MVKSPKELRHQQLNYYKEMVGGSKGKFEIVGTEKSKETSMDFIKRHKIKISAIGIGLLLFIIILLAVTLPKTTTGPDTTAVPETTENPNKDIFTGLKAFPEGDICFDSSNKSSYESYVKQLDDLMSPYRDIKQGGRLINCHEETRQSDEICFINSIWVYPCGNRNWGFEYGSPCVILSYINDTSYEPTAYRTLDEVSQYAPQEVQEIASEELEDGGEFQNKLVRLYCTHVNLDDYHPSGFYEYFFPNNNNSGYLPPIAAVQFNFNDDDYNIIDKEYEVECSLWSRRPAVDEVKKVSFKIKHGSC